MRKITALFYIVFSLVFLVACSANNYATVNSSKNGIVLAYDAYGMTPTLTEEAKGMAARHCSQFHKDAYYIGWEIPNPLLTKEHHGFECVERDIDTGVLLASVERAMSSNSATNQLQTYLECVRSNIVSLDDMTSDASTVAFAVADVCSSDHSGYVEDVVKQISYSSDIKGIVRNAILETAGTKVIPYVLNWRKIVKQGFSRDRKPSQTELPNNLYSASVAIAL